MSAAAPVAAGPAPTSPPDPDARGPRRGPLAGGLAVLAIAAIVLVLVDPFGGPGEPASVAPGAAATSLATIERGPLASRVYENGTLDYAARADGSPYAVVNQAAGAFTALPRPGEIVDCGEVLYRVAGDPVVLLCGRTPAYRSLSAGMAGRDVRQLNRNLVRLDYATRSQIDPSSRSFTAGTTAALQRLQDALGLDETGVLELGQAVFLPGPLRITRVSATPGTMARPGAPMAEATSTERHVQVDLDAAQAASVEAGDRVRITLPDATTTRGRVTRVGSVAQAADGESGEGSGAPSATVPVSIRLGRPRDVRGLEQTPVRVEIATEGVDDALSVPVTALVALAGGGYAVETVAAGGAREVVPVRLGLFDHADGRVEVTGAGLAAGRQVVVPAT